MSIEFTEKQKTEIKALKKKQFKRLNIYDGSVRSGKTWVSCVIWCLWVASLEGENNFLMCAKTITALKRNVLEVCLEIFGEDNISYTISTKTAKIFGKTVYLEGANDVSAENKIRGMTLAGAYCDELTLLPENFFKMLLTRLSVTGAKLFATTNPDTPNHWLYKEFLLNEKLDLRRSTFLLDDNTTLDSKYVAELKNEFSGVFYDRFVLGLWVVAEGIIYETFNADVNSFIITEPPENLLLTQIGVDFGGNGSATTFCLTGITRGFKQVITLDEYYFKGSLTPAELEDNFIAFYNKNKKYKPAIAFCDSAEQVLINGIRAAVIKNRLPLNVTNARKGEIINRIRFYTAMQAKGIYKVMAHCTKTIEAFKHAVWDSKSIVDKRLDDGTSNIDSLDAQEYSTENYMNDIIITNGVK